MALEIFCNDASTTVALSQTAVAQGTTQSWTVGSSTLFVDAYGRTASTGIAQFRIVDPADVQQPPEVILVTNVSGTTWSVTRGADNTAPTAHTGTFTVLGISTGVNLMQAIDTIGGKFITASGTSTTSATEVATTLTCTGSCANGLTYRISGYVLGNIASAGSLTVRVRTGSSGITGTILGTRNPIAAPTSFRIDGSIEAIFKSTSTSSQSFIITVNSATGNNFTDAVSSTNPEYILLEELGVVL